MNDIHSLKKRYLFKLSANLLAIPLNFIIQAVVPRGLGPAHYGDYNFLTNFFNQFTGFFDSGTSLGFFTKLSQRPKEKKLVSFYSYLTLLSAFLAVVFTVFMHLSGLYQRFLPGQALFYIYLALFAGITGLAAQVILQMADAYGLTVPAESVKFLQKIIGVFAILLLFFVRRLNLSNYFFYTYLMYFLLFLVLSWIIKRYGYPLLSLARLSLREVRAYATEFYKYCRPFFIYSLLSMLTGIFDRWLLQFYGGSIQQGFFSLSYQIGALCFLFTGAMTPLVIREFSVAYSQKDFPRLAAIFNRHIPLFYLITAFFGAFAVFNSDKISLIIGGPGFSGSAAAVAIMAFFPIHQAYGQLSGSFLYATGQTKVYCNIGVIFMLAGLPLTYFFLAPRGAFGIGAGAVGLAAKSVLIQFLAVNTQLYFNTKMLGLSFWQYLGYQIFALGCLLCIAAAATFFVGQVLFLNKGVILPFCAAGFLYALSAALVVYRLPRFFGVQKGDFYSLWKRK